MQQPGSEGVERRITCLMKVPHVVQWPLAARYLLCRAKRHWTLGILGVNLSFVHIHIASTRRTQA